MPHLEFSYPYPRPQAAVVTIKCRGLATCATWYVSSRQIRVDLGVQLYGDHVRGLTASFDLKLADVGKPLVWQLPNIQGDVDLRFTLAPPPHPVSNLAWLD